MLSIVLVCALLTYGGVSLFVVVFAVYPFAAELFRQSDIPKRLIPARSRSARSRFTMDALPGTPQIQNIIPTTFFKTDDLGRAVARPDRRASSSSSSASPTSSGAAARRRRRAKATAPSCVNEPEPFERREAAESVDRARCRWSSSASRTSSSRELIPRCYGADATSSRCRAGQADRDADLARSPRSGRSKARCCSAS